MLVDISSRVFKDLSCEGLIKILVSMIAYTIAFFS